MGRSLTDHFLVPVANESDAEETARRLQELEFDHLTVCHVIEQTPGWPDPLSVEQANAEAEKSFGAFREFVPDIDTEIRHRSDVVGAIIETAETVGASAIAFRPRKGNRIIRLLSGDRSLSLVTSADRPVIALPPTAEDEE
ncbi:MAG: universal stress protein [Halodesulfurarchaeum sp.]